MTLSAFHAEALRVAVEARDYPTADAALADALDAWSRREEERQDDVLWMRAKIRASLLDPRPSLSIAEVDTRMEAFFAAAEQRDDAAA